MKKLTALVLSLALLLGGCSSEGSKTADDTVLSQSYPWNNYVVYENDNGYYLVNYSRMYLGYHDKSTDTTMMLCNKPECPHDGRDSCTATYKKMFCSNMWLYDNYLYFIGQETSDEELTVSLYRAATDGSSLDKLKVLMTEKNDFSLQEVYLESTLKIKDGIAYASVYPSYNGGGYGGFIVRKFLRIDLNNNYSVREIESSDDYFAPYISQEFYICGDYVIGSRNSGSGSSDSVGNDYIRISVETDEITELNFDTEKLKICGYDNEKFFCERGPEKGENGRFIFEVDPETMEKTMEINTTDYTAQTVLSYEGRLYAFHKGNPVVSVYEDGKEIAVCNYKPDMVTDDDVFSNLCGISDGRLYVMRMTLMEEPGQVYSCSLDALIAGECDWQEVYSMQEHSDGFVGLYFMS